MRPAGRLPRRQAARCAQQGLAPGLIRRVFGLVFGLALFFFLPLLGPSTARATPRLAIEPSPLILPAEGTGETQAELTLHSVGDEPLVLQGVSLSPAANGYRIVEGPGPLLPGLRLAPGESRRLTVAFAPSPGRAGGYGAVLVYSNDPRGQRDPRGQTEHRVLSAGLRVRESVWLVGLWLSALPLLGLGLLRRRRWPLLRGHWGSVLMGVSGLLPLSWGLWLFAGFSRGYGASHGDYGMQFVFQRGLSDRLGLAHLSGVDGGSLILLLALGLWGALIFTLPSLSELTLRRGSRPAAEEELPSAALALVLVAGLGTVVALDMLSLLACYCAALFAVFAALPAPLRRPLGVAFFLSWIVLSATSAWLCSQSLPAPLPDGFFVAHTTDIVSLSYQNYFGDLRPPANLPLPAGSEARGQISGWAGLAYALLGIGALLPIFALSATVLRRPLAHAGRAILLLPPLAILGFGLLTRLGAGLLPQAHGRFAAMWAVLAVCGLALSAIRRAQPTERAAGLGPFAELVPLPIAGALLALASATETGLQAALILILASTLSSTWLGLVLADLDGTSGPRSVTSPVLAPALRPALLLVLGPPGTLASLGHALCVLSAFAALRGLAVLYAVLVLTVGCRGLLTLLALPRQTTQAGPADLAQRVGGGLLIASALACFCAQPLFEVGHTWAQDFIAHTRHASAPVGPGFLAHVFPRAEPVR